MNENNGYKGKAHECDKKGSCPNILEGDSSGKREEQTWRPQKNTQCTDTLSRNRDELYYLFQLPT